MQQVCGGLLRGGAFTMADDTICMDSPQTHFQDCKLGIVQQVHGGLAGVGGWGKGAFTMADDTICMNSPQPLFLSCKLGTVQQVCGGLWGQCIQ